MFAVYDLAVSPHTFDILPFLVAAEIRREELECESMHFVLVPAGDDAADQPYADLGNVSQANYAWRVRQIIMPATALMPSCRSTTVTAGREEAAQIIRDADRRIFPENYSVEAPVAGFSMAEVEAWARRSGDIPTLEATEQALTYARSWIEQHAGGRLPISITLREAFNAESKNSNVEAWARFTRTLDRERYFPFLIRDTDRVFEPTPDYWDGVAQFPLAAVNLELRAAVYECAHLNMIGSSGPTQLCMLDRRTRCLIYNIGVPGWHDTRAEAYRENYGIEMGDQLCLMTPFQRLVWGADDYETITRHFDLMIRFIEGGMDALTDDDEKKFFAENEEESAVFADRLFQGRQWGPAKKIYRHLLKENQQNVEYMHRLGVSETWSGDPEKGLSFIQQALDCGHEHPDVYVGKGEALMFLGQGDQAAANFHQALVLDQKCFAGALRLGLLCEAQNDLEEARRWLQYAVEIDANSPSAQNYLGLVLQKLGESDAAAKAFREGSKLTAEKASKSHFEVARNS